MVVNLPLSDTELGRAAATRLVRKTGTDISLQIKMIEPDKAIFKLTLRVEKETPYPRKKIECYY